MTLQGTTARVYGSILHIVVRENHRSMLIPAKESGSIFGTGAGGDIFTLAGELCNSTDFIRQAEFIAEKMRIPVAKATNLSLSSNSRPLRT